MGACAWHRVCEDTPIPPGHPLSPLSSPGGGGGGKFGLFWLLSLSRHIFSHEVRIIFHLEGQRRPTLGTEGVTGFPDSRNRPLRGRLDGTQDSGMGIGAPGIFPHLPNSSLSFTLWRAVRPPVMWEWVDGGRVSREPGHSKERGSILPLKDT